LSTNHTAVALGIRMSVVMILAFPCVGNEGARPFGRAVRQVL
jgi:hypothetical protein